MPKAALLGKAGRLKYGTGMPDIPAHTSRLYVAPNGSDANAGTSPTAPLLTIDNAATKVTAGTLVVVRPGTYTPSIRIKNTVAGTSTNRITFWSEVKWGAKIVSGTTQECWWVNADYNDIVGFDITATVVSATEGILLDANNCRALANYVHDIQASPCSSNGAAGIVTSDGKLSNEISGNVVANVGPGTCAFDHAIYSSGQTIIRNNICYGISGYGIHLWHLANNNLINNNLIFQCRTGGMLIGADGAAGGLCNNTDVTNNIVYDCPSIALQAIRETGSTGAANRYISNMINGNASGFNGYQLQNSITPTDPISAAPSFVNYQSNGSGDYRSLPTSATVDSGSTVSLPPLAIDWLPRTYGPWPDLGPYENRG